MKNIFFILLFNLVGNNFGYAQEAAFDILFDNELIELGEINRGEKRTGSFEFKNKGTEPIKIELVSSCECTTLDWTRGEILPNHSGKIDFIFDSTEKKESETVDVDIYFENLDKQGDPIFMILGYRFTLLNP